MSWLNANSRCLTFLGGVPLKVLQELMGHKSVKSTEVYTKIFALDLAAQQRVQFSMPGTDAVAILKNHP